MRTLNIAITDLEFNKFGIKNDQLNFTDFIEIITKELTKQNIDNCIALAEKYGLSKMTMTDISNEVKSVRNLKSIIYNSKGVE